MTRYSAPEPTGAPPTEKLRFPVMADHGEGLVVDVAWCRSQRMASHIAALLDAHERTRSATERDQLRDLLGDDASF